MIQQEPSAEESGTLERPIEELSNPAEEIEELSNPAEESAALENRSTQIFYINPQSIDQNHPLVLIVKNNEAGHPKLLVANPGTFFRRLVREQDEQRFEIPEGFLAHLTDWEKTKRGASLLSNALYQGGFGLLIFTWNGTKFVLTKTFQGLRWTVDTIRTIKAFLESREHRE